MPHFAHDSVCAEAVRSQVPVANALPDHAGPGGDNPGMADTAAPAASTATPTLRERLGGIRLASFETPPWVGVVVAIAFWALVVWFSEPWGRLWGTGQDARCYYQATLADPYLHSEWNDPIAYVYSPAFLQLVSPLTALPWQAFMAAWTAILLFAVRFLTGPRLLAAGLLFPFTAMEVAGGNVSLLLAVAIVVGFRWPWAWAMVLLTKDHARDRAAVVRGPAGVAAPRDRPRGDRGDCGGVAY